MDLRSAEGAEMHEPRGCCARPGDLRCDLCLARPLDSAELRPSSLQLARALADAEEEPADERAAKVGLQAQVHELKAALVSEHSRRGARQRREERERREEAEARRVLVAEAATLKELVKELEVELESTRNKCLSAYSGLVALEDEKRELERRLAEAQGK